MFRQTIGNGTYPLNTSLSSIIKQISRSKHFLFRTFLVHKKCIDECKEVKPCGRTSFVKRQIVERYKAGYTQVYRYTIVFHSGAPSLTGYEKITINKKTINGI